MPTTRWTTPTSFGSSIASNPLPSPSTPKYVLCRGVRVYGCVRGLRVRSAQEVRACVLCGRRATSCTERRCSRPRRSRTRRLVTSTSSPWTTSRGSRPTPAAPVVVFCRVELCRVVLPVTVPHAAQTTLDPLRRALRQGYGSANLYTLLGDSHVALTQLEKVRHHPELFSVSCVSCVCRVICPLTSALWSGGHVL